MVNAGLGYTPEQMSGGAGLNEATPVQAAAPMSMRQRSEAIRGVMDQQGVSQPEALAILGLAPPAAEPAPEPTLEEPDDRAGRGEMAITGLQAATEQAARGTGQAIADWTGIEAFNDIGEDVADYVGPTDEAEQRMAEASLNEDGTEKNILGKVADAITMEAGNTVAQIGGIWAGGKIGGPKVKALMTAGALVNAVGRMYDQASGNREDAIRLKIAAREGSMPDQVTDDQVRAEFSDDDRRRSTLAASVGLTQLLPLKLIFPAQKAEKLAVKGGLIVAAGKKGTAVAAAEGAQEFAEEFAADFWTDQGAIDKYESLPDEEKSKILPWLLSANSEKYIVAALASAGLGVKIGAVAGAAEQSSKNEFAESQARKLEDVARQRGASAEDINQAISNGKARDVAVAARKIEQSQHRVDMAEGLLKEAQAAAVAGEATPKDVEEAQAYVDKRVREQTEFMDGLGGELGIKTWQKKADVDRAKAEEERTRRDAALKRLDRYAQPVNKDVDQQTVTQYADKLDETEAAVEAQRTRVEAITNPERKAQAQAELDNAAEASRAARVEAKMALQGMTHLQATQAVKEDAKRTVAEQRLEAQRAGRERAVERQMELEMPEAMPEAQRKARAQEILDEDAAEAKQDKGLDNKLNRLRRQRRAATSDEDIDRLTNEIANLEARRGLPTPAVEAARRVLQVSDEQARSGAEELSPGTEATSAGEAEPVTGAAAPVTSTAKPADAPALARRVADGTATPAEISAFRAAEGDNGKTLSTQALQRRARRVLSQEPRALEAASYDDATLSAAERIADDTATPEDRAAVREAAGDPDLPDADLETVASSILSTREDATPARADTSGYDLPNGNRYRDLTKGLKSDAALFEHMRQLTKDSGHEVAAHVRGGKVLAIGTNDQVNSVMLPKEGFADPEVEFIHTHTSDTPFSAADVRAMLHSGQPFVALLPNGETLRMSPIGRYDPKAEALINDLMVKINDLAPRYLPLVDRARVRQEALLQLLEVNGNLSYDTPLESLSEPHMELVNGIVTEIEGSLPRDGGRVDAGEAAAQDVEPGGQVGPDGVADAAEDAGPAEAEFGAVDADIDEFADEGSQGTLGGVSFRSSRRDRLPTFNRERVRQLALDTIAGREKRGRRSEWYKDYLSGDLPLENIERALETAIRLNGMKKMMVIPEIARAMYPDMKLTTADFEKRKRKQSGSTRDGKTYYPLKETSPAYRKMKGALELTNAVRYSGHGAFGRQTNNLLKGNFGYRTMFFEASPDLRDFVEFKTPENARFDPPVPNPDDTDKIKRQPTKMRFGEEAMKPLRRTARYLQGNRYKLNKEKIFALTPDDMISGKAYGDFGFGPDDVARLDALEKVSMDRWSDEDKVKFTPDGVKLFKEARKTAAYKLEQLKIAYTDFAAIHGEDADVGFLYQVDSRGRIYADGSFHPQAGSKIKGLFEHEGVSLSDMVEVDNAASGWQVNALIARDHVAAPKLNMGAGQATEPGFKKQDLYTDTLNNMRALMKRDAAMDTSAIKGLAARRAAEKRKRNAKLFLDGPFRDGVEMPVTRPHIKPAIIAVNYGGGTYQFRKVFMSSLKAHVNAKGAMEDNDGPWGYISNLGLEALRETAPHALAFQDWAIESISKVAAAIEAGQPKEAAPRLEISIGIDGRYADKKLTRIEGLAKPRSKADGQLKFKMLNNKQEFVGPDGLMVPIMKNKTEQAVKEDSVEVKLFVNTDNVDADRTGRAYFANIIQGFDAAILHRAVERYKQVTNGAFITTNHDSFTVPKEHEGAIAAAVRESMATVMTEVDVPARLYADLKSQAAKYGVDVDIQPFDGMGDYNMDDLGSSSPLFGEEKDGRPDDFVPKYDVLPPSEPFLRAGIDDEPAAVPGRPAPLYVSRIVQNGAEIKAWAEGLGLPVTVPIEEMHTTTAYSTAPVDVANAAPDTSGRTEQVTGRLAKMGDNLVLEFAPDTLGLSRDYQKYRDAGASYDYPAYRPHITLNTDAADVSIEGLPEYTGTVTLGPEEQRQLNLDDDPTNPGGIEPMEANAIDMANYMEQYERPQSILNRMYEGAKTPMKSANAFAKMLEREVTNSFQPIRSLESKLRGDGTIGIGMDSAFKAAEMAINDSGRNEALLYYGAGAFGKNMEFRPAAGTVGLREIFKTASGGKKDGQRLQHWFEYMAALRAKQLNADGIKTPLTPADIATALAREDQSFKDARKMWQDHNRANLKMVLDSGRITQEQHDAMANDEAYVPFYRVDQKLDGSSPEFQVPEFKRGASGELRMRDPGIAAMKGGDKTRISNMAESMIRNSQAMVAASMRNVAANKTFDLMEQAGIVSVVPGNVPKKPRDAIVRYKDGQEDWIVPQDEDAAMIIGALGTLQPIQLEGIARAMNAISSTFRASITTKPSFIINNLWRGALANGILTQGANITASSNTLTGALRTLGVMNDQAYRDFKQISGMGDFRLGQAETGFGKSDILVDIGLDKPGVFYYPRKMFQAWEMLGTASEFADRIAVFETMKKRGVRDDEAAYQALNVMNYSRRGGNVSVRTWISTMPFLNARLQGYARLTEGTIGPRATPETRKKAFQRMALTGLLYTTATAAAWVWNNDDEERRELYQELPAWRRTMFFNVVLPNGFILTLPQPFELGFLFSAIPTSVMDQFADSMPFVGEGEEVENIDNAFQQVGAKVIGDIVAFSMIPQALGPILEANANYNTFFGSPIERQAETSLDPDLRDANADELSRVVGQDISIMGQPLSNFINLSPAMLTHYGSNFGGVPYTLMSGLMHAFASDVGLVPKAPTTVFGDNSLERFAAGALRGFVFDPSMSQNRFAEEYYKAGQEATERMRSFRVTEDIDRLKGAPEGSALAYRAFNKTNSVISDLNKARREIEKSEELTPDEKRRQLQQITKARNTLMEGISQGMLRAMEPE